MALLLAIDKTSCVCPDISLLKPCSCKDDNISCGGNEDIDLVKIFQTLSKKLTKDEKHFKEFYLNNTFITELKENTFSDITFKTITIIFCSNLNTINTNAFNTTDSVTNQLMIRFNPKIIQFTIL